jgi:hypothetical protein
MKLGRCLVLLSAGITVSRRVGSADSHPTSTSAKLDGNADFLPKAFFDPKTTPILRSRTMITLLSDRVPEVLLWRRDLQLPDTRCLFSKREAIMVTH